MSTMLFLRLDGIEGEEPIGDSQKMISLMSYRHRVGPQITSLRPSAGEHVRLRRSPCQHGLFTVIKGYDKTSPELFRACTAGVEFPKAIVFLCTSDVRKNSSKPITLLRIVMENAVMADYSYYFEGGWQIENIGFRYASIGWISNWIDPDTGDDVPKFDVGWDGVKNVVGGVDALPKNLDWDSS
jgi:type VI protein secretion system component Hcp